MDRYDRERTKNKAPQQKITPEISIPAEQVVALKYDSNKGAPKVIAKGSGYIAEKILDIATENEIPVHTDKQLAAALDRLDLGEMIPDELFAVVAQIYAFVDRIDAVIGDMNKSKKNN